MRTPTWHNCYDGSWRDLIVPDAFSHPAKFAPALVGRIYAHGLKNGWWRKGDLIGDPFGGICGGGIMAGYAGLNWIGVELEPRFVELGNKNLALHGPKWMVLGEASCVKLVQGDSRRFAEIIGAAAGIVTSPPYAESLHLNESPADDCARLERKGLLGTRNRVGEASKIGNQGYGASNGNIGNLKEGELSGVVTSPPYAGMSPEKGSGGVDIQKQWNTYRNSGGGQSLAAFIATQQKHSRGYGSSAGQIGDLREGTVNGVVTSPPYNKPFSQEHPGRSGGERGTTASEAGAFVQYGVADGQIEGLPNGTIDGVVTSPPYEGSEVASACKSQNANGRQATYKRAMGHNGYADETPGQIGSEGGETYWQAMAQVYRQCYLALRPGGYMAVVVKDYVQNKKRVPLCDQTMQLLTHCGFEPVERIRAMLVREETHECMFTGRPVTKTKERKSFFRRLAEKKGSPRIDWEEVLVVRRGAA